MHFFHQLKLVIPEVYKYFGKPFEKLSNSWVIPNLSDPSRGKPRVSPVHGIGERAHLAPSHEHLLISQVGETFDLVDRCVASNI